VCGACFQSSIDHAVNALDLVLLWQDGDVVLEWVWDPEIFAAHIGNTLVGIPVLGLGQRLVDTVVKVLVVGEDDMATDIVELRRTGLDSIFTIGEWQTHEAFRSDICGGKTTGCLV